jgi:lactate permease
VSFFLALLPIMLIIALMVGFRWGASRSGGAGYLLTLLLAVVFFGARLELLAYAHMKALLLAFDVLLIIWAAFLLFKVADEAGAIRTIGEILPNLTADKTMQALIIGWVFAAFLQGIGGFGVPVAVIAPILIGLDFPPLLAVILPSIGHGWAVSFGSLGSSFNALQASTGLGSDVLAGPVAIFLGTACVISGLMMVHASGSWRQIGKYLFPVLAIGGVMAVGQYLVATAGLWNIASFAGAAVGMAVAIPIGMCGSRKDPDRVKPDWSRLFKAMAGYLVLIVLILGIQFIPGVKPFLGQVKLEIAFPEITTAQGYVTPAGTGRSIPILTHAGTILLYASVIGFLIYKKAGQYQPGAGRRILAETAKKMTSSSISILSMVSLAVIMEHSGMTRVLAEGLSSGIQSLFPLVSPWIGAIGAFMTGSNTNSNVVFGLLQLQTAQLLGLPVAVILAGQTSGAALSSVLAPTKLVVGASTAGMAGKEGQVMRSLIVYTLILVGSISLLTQIGVWIAGG